MNVVYRNSKNFMKGNIDLAKDRDGKIKSNIEMWNNSFNIDYFSFRKRLRRVSYDILKQQKPIKKIHIYIPDEIKRGSAFLHLPEYLNDIYVPMDDDDIFVITEEEFDECMSCLNNDVNAIITGYWLQHVFLPKAESNILYNRGWNHIVQTNNLIYNHQTPFHSRTGGPFNHWKAHKCAALRPLNMKHIDTSLHLLHPCSVTSFTKNWPGKEPILDRVLKFIQKFTTTESYKAPVGDGVGRNGFGGVPKKFWEPICKYIEVYNDLKLK